jgi:hypothetical protein
MQHVTILIDHGNRTTREEYLEVASLTSPAHGIEFGPDRGKTCRELSFYGMRVEYDRAFPDGSFQRVHSDYVGRGFIVSHTEITVDFVALGQHIPHECSVLRATAHPVG